jgi:ABC-2 type transport system permease protein
MIRNYFPRWSLVREQIAVQLLVRTLNFSALGLLVLQPFIFSVVGMLLSRAAGNSVPDLVYSVIGGGIMGMWSGIVFISSYDISGDRYNGMLELIVGSPTPLESITAIRSLSNVLAGFFTIMLAFLAAMFIFGYSLAGANLWGTGVSLLLLLLSMWTVSVFLAFFFIWSRISGSFVEYLEMPVAILCGFMFPIRVLPGWMQAISGFIPIRWALEAMNESLLGMKDITYLASHWLSTLVLAGLLLALTHWMHKKVEDIIRINGELSKI